MAYLPTHTGYASKVSLVDQFKAYLRERAKHRKDKLALTRMLKMSNRDLADIGLTRDDVRVLMMQPTIRSSL